MVKKLRKASNRPITLEKVDEKLLTLIVTNIHDMVSLIDANGCRRYVSPSVRKVLGYSPEELVGNVNYDHYYPEDAPQVREQITTAIEGSPVSETRLEYRFRRKDGLYCWLEGEVSRIVDDTGKLTQLLVISRDITARKRSERDLQESHDRLALAIDAAKAGVWGFEHGEERQVSYRQWWGILGYDEGEVAFTRETWLDLCHPEDRQLVEQSAEDFLAGRTAKFELEYRMRHKNGSYRWVLVNGKMVDSQHRKAPRWAGLLFDITDLRNLREALHESERRLRDFAQAIPDAGMILDENGRYVEVFGQGEKLLPRPPEKIKGYTIHQVLLPRDADILLGKIRQTIKTGQPQQFSMELKKGNRLTEVRMAPMKYLADGKKAVATVFTDITEKRRAEKRNELILALRRRSKFVEDIIRGRDADPRVAKEARAFGIDPFSPLCCSIVHIEMPANCGKTSASHALQQSRIIELLSEEPLMFVWDNHGDIGVINWRESMESDPEEGKPVAKRILEAVAACEPRLRVAIGIGDMMVGLAGIRKSFRQAVSAVLVARSLEGPNAVCRFCDIGVYKLLASFGGEEEAREYVQETLGKIIAHDRQKKTDLLHTLEVLLESASLKEAAQRLFLHYNTAVLHKRRIEKILGAAIEDAETRLMLATAVKLYRLWL